MANGEREPTRAGDRFEAENMHDGSRVLHRDKKVSRWMALALIIPGLFTYGIATFVALVNSTSDKPLPAAALPIVVALLAALATTFIVLGLVFAVLRTIVTEEALHVKYGLWGPRVPLRAIRSCKVVPYDWTDYGGWGIRRGRDGSWAYVVSGNEAVEILYEEDGAIRRILVGGEHPKDTAIEVNRALRALEKPRVAARPSPIEREFESDQAEVSEAEDLAVEEAREAKR